MRRKGWALCPDRRGNAAIEFAMIAPVFITLVAAAVELSMVLLTSGSLQAAVVKASRHGVTGQVAAGEDRRAAILRILSDRTFGLIDLDSAEIRTMVYPNFAAIGTSEAYTDVNDDGIHNVGEPFSDSNGNGVWDSDMGAAGLGGPGDVVLYAVSYRSRLATSVLEPMVGEISYSATVAVRNEPF